MAFIKSILDVLIAMLPTIDWSTVVPAAYVAAAKELADVIVKLYNTLFPATATPAALTAAVQP